MTDTTERDAPSRGPRRIGGSVADYAVSKGSHTHDEITALQERIQKRSVILSRAGAGPVGQHPRDDPAPS